MIKLYKRAEDGRLAYHEAWVNDGAITEHWGIAGTRGESRDHAMKSPDEEKELEGILAEARRAGYEEIDADDERRLIVEYSVDGMGTSSDLEKRNRLEDHLNELLGWTGLGNCDGGSMGSGTMEVCCFVVDYARSKAVIEENLKGTGFADYSRIYDEDDDAG
jgi:predicted DNA-binding WGR domain protein